MTRQQCRHGNVTFIYHWLYARQKRAHQKGTVADDTVDDTIVFIDGTVANIWDTKVVNRIKCSVKSGQPIRKIHLTLDRYIADTWLVGAFTVYSEVLVKILQSFKLYRNMSRIF